MQIGVLCAHVRQMDNWRLTLREHVPLGGILVQDLVMTTSKNAHARLMSSERVIGAILDDWKYLTEEGGMRQDDLSTMVCRYRNGLSPLGSVQADLAPRMFDGQLHPHLRVFDAGTHKSPLRFVLVDRGFDSATHVTRTINALTTSNTVRVEDTMKEVIVPMTNQARAIILVCGDRNQVVGALHCEWKYVPAGLQRGIEILDSIPGSMPLV